MKEASSPVVSKAPSPALQDTEVRARPVASEPPTELDRALSEGAYAEALSLCATHYGSLIGRLCMAMLSSQAEAEEAAQETLLTAFEKFGSYRGDASVRAWLLAIARNKCLKRLEQRRRQHKKLTLIRHEEHDRAARGTPPISVVLEAESQRREQAAKARCALEQITPTEREALLLRYLSELSYEEIAVTCNVSATTARKRVSRGLSRLRRAIKEES